MLPKHYEFRLPILNLLKDGRELQMKDLVPLLQKHYNLTDDEISEVYPSGNGEIFYDRISWALSYMSMSGLIEKPKRGVNIITKKGLELLKSPEKINKYIDEVLKDSLKNKEETTSKKLILSENQSNDLTPQEKLFNSYTNIRKNVYSEILNTILNKKPIEFEKLVVMLLQKMGYGGEIKNSGFITKYSNDGGIDGVIKEDVLGFGRIHIQAKRYNLDASVGREDIQKFVGALAVAQSNKGVFITTSYFSKGAIDYVANLNGTTTIVLIDGKQLAEYIYDFDLGMQTEQIIQIKKLDFEFWDTMMDN